MPISDFAKNYHKKMFGDLKYNFYKTDPEFTEKFANFSFDTIIKECDLDERTRFIVILASIIGCNGIDEYEVMLNVALNCCVKPIEVKEIVYQAVFTFGIGRTFTFLRETNKIFEQNNIEMPLENNFNENKMNNINKNTENLTRNIKECREKILLKNWINESYYLRDVFKPCEIELIKFCFLMASGKYKEQLEENIKDNIDAGNSREFLMKIILQCMPYIGYLKSIYTLKLIKENE